MADKNNRSPLPFFRRPFGVESRASEDFLF